MCGLVLFYNSVDDILDGGFKELRDIGSTKVSTETADTRDGKSTPLQLQLTEPDAVSFVFVSGRSELDVLWFVDVAEAEHGGFFEASDDVVQVLNEW